MNTAMKVIKADHDRRIAIPGVADPVLRPVDIDPSRTGFASLRSLRIYRFDNGSTIDGHAEEDEVFVVVMAGSIELTVTGDNSGEEPRPTMLSSVSNSNADPCVAYLPPHSAYRLIAKTDADVAYARATPASGNPSAVFTARGRMDAPGVTVLLEEETYAQRLRLRVVHINADRDGVDLRPLRESETMCEALIHIRTVPTEEVATITSVAHDPIQLKSWDTAVVNPEDSPTLYIATNSSALILLVLAV